MSTVSTIIEKNLSYKIMNCVFSVHNILGCGLLECAYEQALVIELKLQNVPFERQKVYPLFYKGELAGAYLADLVVDGKVILELKSVNNLSCVHEAQLLNYLRLSGIQVGYLVNFNKPSLEWKRFVVT